MKERRGGVRLSSVVTNFFMFSGQVPDQVWSAYLESSCVHIKNDNWQVFGNKMLKIKKKVNRG